MGIVIGNKKEDIKIELENHSSLSSFSSSSSSSLSSKNTIKTIHILLLSLQPELLKVKEKLKHDTLIIERVLTS
jgi:hypothetical protein